MLTYFVEFFTRGGTLAQIKNKNLDFMRVCGYVPMFQFNFIYYARIKIYIIIYKSFLPKIVGTLAH